MTTQKEPIKGWLDNVYGPQGLMLAGGLGLPHVVRINKNLIADFVPADKVSNCIVTAAWHVSTLHPAHIRVINCVSRPQNPITTYKYLTFCDGVLPKYPLEKAIGYYSLTITESKIIETFFWFVTQWLYGHIIDAILMLMGKKPMFAKASRKLDEALVVLGFFIFNEFIFDNNNCQEMAKTLNDYDRQKYNFDMSDINWNEYCADFVLGVREYILKDPKESKERARRKQKWLFVVYYGYWIIVLLSFGYLALTLFRITSMY